MFFTILFSLSPIVSLFSLAVKVSKKSCDKDDMLIFLGGGL